MKKLLFVVAVAFVTFSASAQVKLGFGLGYASPMGDIADVTDGGISGHFELGYGITEQIDASIYYQEDFLAGGSTSIGSETAEFGAVAIGTYMLNGRYFFTDSKFKPYGSLGLGLASIGSIEIEGSDNGVEDADAAESTSNFAFRPAIGFKYGVLNMNLAYLNAGKVGDGSVSDLTFNIGLLFTFGGN